MEFFDKISVRLIGCSVKATELILKTYPAYDSNPTQLVSLPEIGVPFSLSCSKVAGRQVEKEVLLRELRQRKWGTEMKEPRTYSSASAWSLTSLSLDKPEKSVETVEDQ